MTRPAPATAPALASIADFPAPSGTYPAGLTSGLGGKLWFTEDVSKAIIGSFDLSTQSFTTYSLNQGIYAFKAQGIAPDANGHLWVSANGTYAYQFDPSTGASENYQENVSGSEQSVTLGPGGDMWFTGSDVTPGCNVYKVDPATAQFTPYPITGGSCYLFGITTGPDGNLWFLDDTDNAVGELDPTTGVATEYPLPTPDAGPETITVGSDGNLWFTEENADKIGKIDPATHAITEYPVPTSGASPRCITSGPDGSIWFTEQDHAAIGQVDPATGAITEYSVADTDPNGADTFLDGITTGPDGNLWITDENDQLLRFSLSPTVVSNPSSQTVSSGAVVSFTATARGIPVPTAQWQESTDGGATWWSIPGATSTTLSLTASPSAAVEYRAVFTNSVGSTASASASLSLAGPTTGYWLAGRDGGVFAFGNAPFLGSLPSDGVRPAEPIVAVASTPDGRGYWLVGSDGGVFAFGDARFFGSLPSRGIRPNEPVVGIAPTSDGAGYWLVGSDGGVFAFGDATYHGGGPGGSVPAVGLAPAPAGYWVANEVGGIAADGGAPDFGSLTSASPPVHPAAPLVSIASDGTGTGYWLAGADGGVFSFGGAPFLGSLPSGSTPVRVSAPITALAAARTGPGYWLVGSDGGVFAFGDASFLGSLPELGVRVTPANSIVSIAARS